MVSHEIRVILKIDCFESQPAEPLSAIESLVLCCHWSTGSGLLPGSVLVVHCDAVPIFSVFRFGRSLIKIHPSLDVCRRLLFHVADAPFCKPVYILALIKMLSQSLLRRASYVNFPANTRTIMSPYPGGKTYITLKNAYVFISQVMVVSHILGGRHTGGSGTDSLDT